MSNPSYESGRRKEWKVRDLLRAAGASHVERTAGSHGACDLIADFPEWTWAIQVKGKPPTAAEIDAVRKASEHSSRRWAMLYIDGRNMETTCFRKGKPWKIPPPGLEER